LQSDRYNRNHKMSRRTDRTNYRELPTIRWQYYLQITDEKFRSTDKIMTSTIYQQMPTTRRTNTDWSQPTNTIYWQQTKKFVAHRQNTGKC